MKTCEPIFRSCAEKWGWAISACVVYEEIESPKSSADLLEKTGDLAGVGKIALSA
jgi:hypothetical protein